MLRPNSSAAPQTAQIASSVCGTKNFSSVRLTRRRNCIEQDNSGEIAGSTSYLRLIPLLPLNEFFKQSLGCIGPFFSRSSGGRFGNSGFRVFAFLHRLKLPKSLKQRLRVFGRHLSRRSRRRSGNGNGNFRGIIFWLRKSV